MSSVQTTNAKYVFMDVVGFTVNRSVEAQTDVVDAMNAAVRNAIAAIGVPDEQLICIPTGDGLCLAILDQSHPYDVHVQLAVEILSRVRLHNEDINEANRQFQLRVGVGANIDNIVVDLNGRKNVAGAGISTAQRVMSFGDGGQVLVSRSVFEVLSQREAYWGVFREYTAVEKHGRKLSVYQYVPADQGVVNTATPRAFTPKQPAQKKLSEFAAAYLAEAIENEAEVMRLRAGGANDYALTVTLYYRGEDRVRVRNATQFAPPSVRALPEDAPFAEQYAYYKDQEFWLNCGLAEFVTEGKLSAYWECFDGPLGNRYLFASTKGRERLQEEWPEIAGTVNE